MTDNLDSTPVGLPTTMSDTILTVIMPSNSAGRGTGEGHALTAGYQQSSNGLTTNL